MQSVTNHERVAALLASPGGCVLLLMLDESRTPVTDLVTPCVGLRAIAEAVGHISPWNGFGHDRILRTVFAYRDRHRERLERLAFDLVGQPGIEWMWAGVDLDDQLWLPQERGWVERGAFEAGRSGATGDWADPYEHEPRPLLSTSNRYGGISPELAHLASGAGDWILEPPIPRRRVRIRLDARIRDIQTPYDWHEFVLGCPADGDHRTHPGDAGQPWGATSGLLVPDWRAAANIWDGVHISPWAYLTVIQMRVESDAGWTEPWVWEGPHTVWLDWVFTSIEELPLLVERPDIVLPYPKALDFSDPAAWLMMPPTFPHPTPEEPVPAMTRTDTITREPFGEVDGQPVERFTLANETGLSVSVLNYGGIIQSLVVPDRHGDPDNVVLGFSTLQEYVEKSPYFGAIVGRYANRIARGRFTLDGREHRLPVNNGPNTLHGGVRGFDRRVWSADIVTHEDSTHSLVLRLESHDGDEGYPGNLRVTVSYSLAPIVNALQVFYLAETDAPTVVNLSNHSYFNLGGEGSSDILRHVIQLRASRYLPVDEYLIPTGEIAPVSGTPFDFTEAHIIGERIDSPGNEQLAFAGGYDHCWVADTVDELGFQPSWLARVIDPGSGRVMDVGTDQPGVQFYTGNFLDGSFAGTSGRAYAHRSGFCLETQHFPDSPNQPAFPNTVLRPGEQFTSRTHFSFGVLPSTPER